MRFAEGLAVSNHLQGAAKLAGGALGGLAFGGFGDADGHVCVGSGHHAAAGEGDEDGSFQLGGVGAGGAIFIGVVGGIGPVVHQNGGDAMAQECRVIGRAVVFFNVVVKLVERALRVDDGKHVVVGDAAILHFFAVGVAHVFVELLNHFIDESDSRCTACASDAGCCGSS